MSEETARLAWRRALDAHKRAAEAHDRAAQFHANIPNHQLAAAERARAERERDRHAALLARHPTWAP